MSLKQRVGRPLRRVQRGALVRLLEPGFEDTDASLPAHDIGLERADDHHYEPSGWTQPWRGMRDLDIGRQDVFADLGSGKGRVVFLVARFWPFGRVIGVELSEELDAVARRNLEVARPRLKCKDVELVVGDLMTWRVPDDLTVAYHNNSVGGEVLDGMLAQLVASLDRRPRTMRFIYCNPLCHDQVMATGRFRLLRQSKGPRPDLKGFWVNVYEAR